jgi:hypothetical protein
MIPHKEEDHQEPADKNPSFSIGGNTEMDPYTEDDRYTDQPTAGCQRNQFRVLLLNPTSQNKRNQ